MDTQYTETWKHEADNLPLLFVYLLTGNLETKSLLEIKTKI